MADMRDRSSHTKVCDECGSTNIMEDGHSGDSVCTDCGLVKGRIIDQGAEWRSFAEDDGPDKSRVGAQAHHLLSSGSSMSTTIARGRDDGKEANTIGRLADNLNSSDRHLLEAFRQLRSMGERINIPALIRSRAEEHYRDIYVSRQLRGRKKEGILAAALYIACKQEGVPRTFKEIGSMTSQPNKEIHKCYKMALKALGLGNLVTGGAVSAEEFVQRFCSYLQVWLTDPPPTPSPTLPPAGFRRCRPPTERERERERERWS